ncbi:bifunctional phosphoserine phosphatase/homoserine phosphotransferase ThrH [Noviherbaspirillum denitrificans]|uniref:phosphoserine phosphatase n=1 Tax=Noviherbaspirillum denitrificans TaxID=1968433 RepID=A0A254TJN3_9BURK|nr:bifunctional phosphoserine phosphatase/homoserine phosphotransferase ThrH [Noviherbaspirillum denitrificans]OWW22407.1 phosphoserine phosphatase/homoserine phosphotransferase bifunctional protein [Noviherbaspirillum denitrificans]
MHIICLDLEGVLVPEIWIECARRMDIPGLCRTTRDEPDYDKLMSGRLDILRRHKLGLRDIQQVIGGMQPLPGAPEFLHALRKQFQVVILSDTFYEFAMPLMEKLGWPTLFCHHLDTAPDGSIAGYRLRVPDQKRASVAAFKALNFRTIAAGDSYNDVGMLQEADAGILFCPPPAMAGEYPQFPVTHTYAKLLEAIAAASR